MCLFCHIIGLNPKAKAHKKENCRARDFYFGLISPYFQKCRHCDRISVFINQNGAFCFGDCVFDKYGRRL